MKKIFQKKTAALLLMISIVGTTFYAPFFTPKAEAFLGFGDIVIDVKALADRVADGIAMALAQKMIDRMVQSTIDWAQNGFDGNPAYAVNPEQFFLDIGDSVAGDFIAGSDLNFLCSPFQTQIRLALRTAYLTPDNKFQCTITDIVGNLENFYESFSEGGWDAWFSMTQNSANNPYGAYIDAKIELDNRLAEKLGLEDKKLDWGSGFLSFPDKSGPCAVWKDSVTINTPTDDSVEAAADSVDIQRGECLVYAKTSTPGSVISAQLNNALPAGLNKLITAQHVDQLISAFATGLLQRYVFGEKGLFGRGGGGGGNEQPTVSENEVCQRLFQQGIVDANCNPIVTNPNTSQANSPVANTAIFNTPTSNNNNGAELTQEQIANIPDQFERYNELIAIKESRPNEQWTSADFESGLVGEFTSLLNPLGYAYELGLLCLDQTENRLVSPETPGATCVPVYPAL